jgi:hypothetical protein
MPSMADPISTRLHGVPQLVQDQGPEEEDGGDDRHREIGAVGQPRVGLREHTGRQRPDDQGHDQQPAPVRVDFYAGDPAQAKARLHESSDGPLPPLGKTPARAS